jgi:hypothetical protein
MSGTIVGGKFERHAVERRPPSRTSKICRVSDAGNSETARMVLLSLRLASRGRVLDSLFG